MSTRWQRRSGGQTEALSSRNRQAGYDSTMTLGADRRPWCGPRRQVSVRSSSSYGALAHPVYLPTLGLSARVELCLPTDAPDVGPDGRSGRGAPRPPASLQLRGDRGASSPGPAAGPWLVGPGSEYGCRPTLRVQVLGPDGLSRLGAPRPLARALQTLGLSARDRTLGTDRPPWCWAQATGPVTRL